MQYPATSTHCACCDLAVRRHILLHDDLQAINRAIHERRAARGITMAALRKADSLFSRKPECVPRDSLT